MVEDQNELKLTIGTEEARVYEPKKVKVVDVSIWTSENGNKKFECHVKHPDADEPIKISAVKYINPVSNKVEISGLWVNKDSEGKLRKNSASSCFLNFVGCPNFEALKGKELDTIQQSSDSKYLAFKGY